MTLLLGFAFLAGLVTMLTPCMWPMLPIVLSANIKGKDHKRPLGVTIGVMASFAIFTLSVSYLVRAFHFDPNILRIFAVVVIVFLGLTLLIPKFTAILEGYVSKLTGFFHLQQRQGDDFKSGLLTGLVLGVVWSPCGGPILASIAALAATGMVSFQVILITFAYVLGVGLPLFFFIYGGQHFITKTRFLSSYTVRIQQVFGVIMILTAIAIYFNYDKVLQVKFLQAFPQLGQSLNGFENSSVVTQGLNKLTGRNLTTNSTDTSGLFNVNYPAPEFTGITQWLNNPDGKGADSNPLTMKELRGKVVLIDFWTYTCINCIRTLPFVTSWYEKYKDQGFVVIGVHTPEFQFEHDTNNVLNAIKMFNIHYPVPQDNNYGTWNAYNNEYWPAEYLIDAQGNVRRTEFGEGHYDQMEMAIQILLKDAGKKVTNTLLTMPDQTPQNQLSPETYLGSSRMQYYYPNGSIGNGTQNFTLSDNIPSNTFSYGGEWNITDEYAVTGKDATLNYNFTAGHVYIILRPAINAQSSRVKVYLDGKAIDASHSGADVHNGIVTVDSNRLYNLIDLHGKTENHILKLEFKTPGIQAYTFTFG